MTITEDASQPSAVHITTTSGSTGSFSPPANSLLVALLAADGPATTTAAVGTVSDSGSHSWTLKVRQNNHASGVDAIGGTCEVWECQLSSAPGSITVSASWTGASNGGNLTVRVLNGAASNQAGAATAGSGGNGTNTVNPTVTLTPTQAGSHVYGAALDYTTNASLTANAQTTSIDQFLDATNGDTWATWKGAADTTTLTSTTFGFTNAAAVYQLAAAEILPASTTAPAFPFTGVSQPRRLRGLNPRRGEAWTPTRGQVNPPFPFNEFKQPRRFRGQNLRRGEAFMPVPAQVVVAPPAYPPQSVRTRVKGLRLFRPHAAAPVPSQAAPPPLVYVPQAVRGRLKLPIIRRHDIAPPMIDQAPAPLFAKVKERAARIFRGKPAVVVPPQVVIVPPAYPPLPARGKKRLWSLRRRRAGLEGWMVGAAPNLCVTPRPNSGTTGRPGSGVTAYNTATTSRPGTGITSRPNTGITDDPC